MKAEARIMAINDNGQGWFIRVEVELSGILKQQPMFPT